MIELKGRLTRGKNISKVGMVLGATIIIGYNMFYLMTTKKIPTMDEQKSIILFGASVTAIFSPIYFSIILDKIGDIFKK
jgi:hypothetical protein